MQDPEHRANLEQAFARMELNGWTNLVAAIRLILAGERDAETACASLDLDDSMVIEAILAGLRDPQTLVDLVPAEPPKAE